MMKKLFQVVARHPGHSGYATGAPLIKRLCRSGLGRKSVEAVMRAGGRALMWAFDGRKQAEPERVRAEWERIMRGIGLNPQPLGNGHGRACATCFTRCTLDLKPGDERTCTTVMSINDELIHRLGGRMVLEERLTDPGGSRCVVRIDSTERPRYDRNGERELWCDEATAQKHFDRIARLYDFIMGYFEVPANVRALQNLSLRAGARVLDLGVGTGLGLLELARRLPHGGRAVAVDTSERMLARSRSRLHHHGLSSRVEFVRADAAKTGMPSSSFDAVYSSFLLDLHNKFKQRAILSEVKRVIKPGGTAIFAVMDGAASSRGDRIMTALYNACYGRWNPLWKTLFHGYAPHCRPIRLEGLFKETGFSVVGRDRAHVLFFPVAIYSVHRL